MIIGQGSTTETLGADSVQELLARALQPMALDGKRVLVIVPDGTRTAPIPLLFRLLHEQIGRRVARLDYLIALGTHQPMSDGAIDRLVGVTAAERAERYPNVAVFNHRWDLRGPWSAWPAPPHAQSTSRPAHGRPWRTAAPQKHEGLRLVPRVPDRATEPPGFLQKVGASGRPSIKVASLWAEALSVPRPFGTRGRTDDRRRKQWNCPLPAASGEVSLPAPQQHPLIAGIARRWGADQRRK